LAVKVSTIPALMPLIIALIHLADAYLRYMAFKRRMDDESKRRLRRWFGWWSPVDILIGVLLFRDDGITPFHYKLTLILGWLPYQIIFMHIVRTSIWQHIFVFGMSALWSFSQHNWSSIFAVILLESANVPLFLTLHACLYLLWFALFFPTERRCFQNMLKNSKFLDAKPLGHYIAVLPLAVLFGPLLLIADGALLHSWQERISRIFLPIVFFFFYYNVLELTENLYEKVQIKQQNDQLKAQLSFLEHHQAIILQNQKDISVLKHDMRHTYRLLYAMLKAEDTVGALDYIKKQEHRLEEASIRVFCHSPLINAALSVYFRQAQNAEIRLTQKVNLPPDLATAEDELAVLLANLLENAIAASRKQTKDRREISLLIRHSGAQCVLELKNRYDAPLTLGENGLPLAARSGHGLGMISLMSFAKKYDAYVDFSQDNGWVKVAMYWEDRAK